MDHSRYVGKLTQEETEELLHEVIPQLDVIQIAAILKSELDETDFEELKAQLEA